MTTKSIKGLKPSHPGALLREDILPSLVNPETGKKAKKVEIAAALGISRQMLDNILAEKTAITPEMAMRIGKLLGNGPAFWINLQAQYDLRIAEAEIDVSEIPTFTAAAA